MSNKMESIKAGSIVQVDPNCSNKVFAGCFVVVTEVKPFGIQGYVQMTGKEDSIGGAAYIRLKWDDIEPCGDAVWMLD